MMPARRRSASERLHAQLRYWTLMLVIALAPWAADVGAADVGSGAFRAAPAIEAQLKRGVSTKADVQKLLGVPNGSGAAILPAPSFNRERILRAAEAGLSSAPDFLQREIWFYEDIATTELKSTEAGYAAKLRQQLLMIFFTGDLFDGYFWTTNSASGQISR